MSDAGRIGDNVVMQQHAPRAPLPVPDRRGLELDVAGYERLTHDVRPLLGIDLAQYRPQQVWRRVVGFATSHGCADPDELVARARAEPDLRAAFREMLTINVSEFFRDPAVWERFRTQVVDPLVASRQSVRVWSAGCSAGYEPYSIAMLFRQASPTVRVQITATDVDEKVLAVARAGRYATTLMGGVSADRRARFFTPTTGGYLVNPEIRAMVSFAQRDLLRDPMPSGFDVIACRNVVIYFTDEAKAKLYRGFANALRPHGTLLIGATESIAGAKALGLDPRSPGFYTRAAPPGGLRSGPRQNLAAR
jgi:chemotaxis protein methyltransferase CheR